MPKFSCPNCQKSLKVQEAVAANKRIRCPGCGEIFRLPGEGEPASVQAGGARASANGASEAPMPTLSAEHMKPAPRPGRTSVVGSAGERTLDHAAPRPSQAKGSGKKRVILLVSATAVLLAVLGVTAFVWPGFLAQESP